MKIRTQFIISTAVFGIILLLVSVLVILTNRRVEKAHQQEELATQIEREAYELGYLADDYLLHRESQQAARWESKFASFSNDLLKMDVSTPEQQALLANIKTNQHRLEAVFAEIRASIESAPQPDFDEKFMQLSWSRLEVQNQGMIFDASRLAGRLREQEDQLRQMTSLLGLVLIGVLGTFLLGNYGLTFRRTLRAIAELQAGTRIIGSGDLDFAFAVKNEDEIGELSHAFNRMTASLKQVTASKAELEKEIMERKQVEEALLAADRKYQALFDNQNSGLAYCSTVFDDQGRPVDYVILDVNDAYARNFGLPRDQLVGKKVTEAFPGVSQDLIDRHNQVAVTGQSSYFEINVPTLGMWFEVNVFCPERGSFVAISLNITARKQAEAALRETNEELDDFNRAMVGRELRMIELKQEVNELCESAGQPPRYPLNLEKEEL